MAKVSIDLNKLKRDVNRQLQKFAKQGVQGLTDQDKKFIGDDMVDLMKDFIAKGISPIEGRGRFPAYKGTEAEARLRSTLRKGQSKQVKKLYRRQKAQAKSIKERSYPYNVMRQYPQKRERPVNLWLSGDQMDDLEARSTSTGLSIGYWKAKSVLKEKGHREGANGQRLRPTIPQGNETFTRPIYQRLLQSLQRRLLRRLEAVAKEDD